MITIPPVLLRAGKKAVELTIKHGPKVMVAAGAGCCVAGTYQACKATLKADEIIKDHKDMMAAIKHAKEIAPEDYTEKDARSDKFQAYLNTGFRFVKLYGSAVSLEITGLSLMIGAFAIMSRRYTGAVAALTAIDQAFSEYRSKAQMLLGDQADELNNTPMRELPEDVELPWEEPKDSEKVSIDPSALDDPFFFIVDDAHTDDWYGDTGFLLNGNWITQTVEGFQLKLDTGATNHVFINDILKALRLQETEVGHYYGWTNDPGDKIVVELTPFIKLKDGDTDDYTMVPLPIELVKDFEQAGDSDGWGYGMRLKTTATPDGMPRMIAKSVF